MKLTVDQLRSIIREEVEAVVAEGTETLTEATRMPENFAKDLQRLPVGGRIDHIRLGDDDKFRAFAEKRLEGRRHVYVLVTSTIRGRFVSEDVFPTAKALAYGIGPFAY
jgi:hypothetical protein